MHLSFTPVTDAIIHVIASLTLFVQFAQFIRNVKGTSKLTAAHTDSETDTQQLEVVTSLKRADQRANDKPMPN